MVFTLLLTSKAWPVFAILGINELMYMARTSIKVIGNCLATAVVARWEGELNPQPETGLVETTNPGFIQDQSEEDRERELV